MSSLRNQLRTLAQFGIVDRLRLAVPCHGKALPVVGILAGNTLLRRLALGWIAAFLLAALLPCKGGDVIRVSGAKKVLDDLPFGEFW